MTIITRNDVAKHLKDRINWQAVVISYCRRDGRKIPEHVRRAVIDNRSETYRMADLLGINLNRYEGI